MPDNGVPQNRRKSNSTKPVYSQATVAVDVDGDGKADYLVTGRDRDGDGIPDGLQVLYPNAVAVCV